MIKWIFSFFTKIAKSLIQLINDLQYKSNNMQQQESSNQDNGHMILSENSDNKAELSCASSHEHDGNKFNSDSSQDKSFGKFLKQTVAEAKIKKARIDKEATIAGKCLEKWAAETNSKLEKERKEIEMKYSENTIDADLYNKLETQKAQIERDREKIDDQLKKSRELRQKIENVLNKH